MGGDKRKSKNFTDDYFKDNEVDIKKIKVQISQCKGSTTKTERFLNELKLEPDNLDQVQQQKIKLRLQQSEENLRKYSDLVLQLALATGNADDEQFEEDEHEERCLFVISILRSLLLAEVSTSAPAGPAPATNESHSSVRLPEIDIPCYDGKDYGKYITFMELFDAVIDSCARLQPVQKLFYFKKYLKGEALALIEGLPLTGDSYVRARELLKHRYDNRFLVVTNHIQALLESQPIIKGTACNLRELVANTRQHIGALKSLGQPTDQWDIIILTILLKKVDQFSCRAFHQERDNTKMPTLEDLLLFMEKRSTSFEESKQSEDDSRRFCELMDLPCMYNLTVYGKGAPCDPPCYVECRDKGYVIRKNTIPFFASEYPPEVTKGQNISHLAAIKVYFGKSSCNCYRLTLLMDVNYFIVTYGGVLGLSFGASLLTVVELIYLLVSGLWGSFSRNWRPAIKY